MTFEDFDIISPEDIDEETIKEHVRYFLFNNVKFSTHFDESQIKIELIKKTKCDMRFADFFCCRLDDLGLKLCYLNDSIKFFDLEKFALMRDYITEDESKEIHKTIRQNEDKSDYELMQVEPDYKLYIDGLIALFGSNREEWDYDKYREFVDKHGEDPRLWPKDMCRVI